MTAEQEVEPFQCVECARRGKTWQGSDPKCAFPGGGVFSPGNWNCALMSKLRDMTRICGSVTYSEDTNCGVVPFYGSFVVLVWYKNRGRVDAAHVVTDENPPRPLDMEFALKVINDEEPDEAY